MLPLKWHIELCLNVLHLLLAISTVFSAVSGPVHLRKYVGEDARFTWSLTGYTALRYPRFGIYNAGSNDIEIPLLAGDRQGQIRPSDKNTSDPFYKGRLFFYGGLLAGFVTFEIRNISTRDENAYMVSMTVVEQGIPPKDIKEKGTLYVRVAPSFLSSFSSPYNIAEGKTLHVPCAATGSPAPNITWIWKTDGRIMAQGKSNVSLNIPSITRVQRGTYECQALNDPQKQPIRKEITVDVQYQPVISPLQNGTVDEKQSITLTCDVPIGNPTPTVFWKKVGGSPTTKPEYSKTSLSITGASKDDAGEYVCVATNNFDGKDHQVRASVFVIVKYKPTITDATPPLTVNESAPMSLYCAADGYPAPTITWSRSQTPFLGNGKYYNDSSVSRSEAGTYTCTATNKMGNDNRDIEVTVNYKPEIDVSSSTSAVPSWKGHEVTLKCVAHGVPPPQFTWNNPNGETVSARVTAISGESQLKLRTTEDSGDYGEYKCRASNLLDDADHIINVTQWFPPGPPVVTIRDIEASSFKVLWDPPSNNGGSDVIDYKVEVRSKAPRDGLTGTELLVSDLEKSTEYLVKVFARNVVGFGKAGANIATTKKQGPPSLPVIEPGKNESTETEVLLKWNKPDENGGTITRYTVYSKVIFSDGKQSGWRKRQDVTVLEYKVQDLKVGLTYNFLVTATNKYGESAMDESKARVIRIVKPKEPSGGKESKDKDNNTPVIAGAAVGGIVFLVVVVAIFAVILRKKRIQGSKRGRRSGNESPYDSMDHNNANGGLDGDSGPTYAQVNKASKKKNRHEDDPTYAEVDKPRKKKPGEIVYAELADFSAPGGGGYLPAALPVPYQETAYADISQFQPQEPEPTYANVSGRGEATYDNVQSM